MSHHHPICTITGKVRFRELKDIKIALRRADRDRSRARANQVACSRHEIRAYDCPDCGGWHLTSQSARTIGFVAEVTPGVPAHESAAAAMRGMVAATGLMARKAA